MAMRKLLTLVAGATILAAGLSGTAYAGQTHAAAAAPPVLSVASCTGSSFCLATGSYSKAGHSNIPLLEEWNGKAWRMLPVPHGFQGGITCTGLSFCLAAGTSANGKGQEDAWNGRTWRKFGAQPPNSGVQCLSRAFCVALSGGIEVYWTGGGKWQAMPGTSPDCGGAWCTIITWGCASTTDCWDSGSYCGDSDCDSGTFYYTDVWNGVTWTETSISDPYPVYFTNQACAGRAFCMSLQLPSQASVTYNWGNTWQSATAHLATACSHLTFCRSLNLLACGSAQLCMALPAKAKTGTLTWNGSEWGFAPLAWAGGYLPTLTGLSCGSSRNCVATGTYQLGSGGSPRPVAEHWNGKAWHLTRLATP
jgi:hypothetical protein